MLEYVYTILLHILLEILKRCDFNGKPIASMSDLDRTVRADNSLLKDSRWQLVIVLELSLRHSSAMI
jgi:hypothetical protein